jgi:hypothetical protein
MALGSVTLLDRRGPPLLEGDYPVLDTTARFVYSISHVENKDSSHETNDAGRI